MNDQEMGKIRVVLHIITQMIVIAEAKNTRGVEKALSHKLDIILMI